jgi:hypothetical protein
MYAAARQYAPTASLPGTVDMRMATGMSRGHDRVVDMAVNGFWLQCGRLTTLKAGPGSPSAGVR